MMNRFWTRLSLVALVLAGLIAAGWAGAPRAQASGLALSGTLSVSPTSGAQTALPGAAAVYTFTLSNSGAAAESVTITPGGSASWVSVGVAPNPALVPAGGSAEVRVTVNVSPAAQPGYMDATLINFVGAGGSAAATVTTTVGTPPTQVPTVPPGANRPLITIESYYYDKDTLRAGDSFKLFLTVRNNGSQAANNLVFSFAGDGLLPQETGGVVAAGSLDAGGKKDVTQSFVIAGSLAGMAYANLPVKVVYTDANGTAYSESFGLTVQLSVYSGPVKPTPTPTQATIIRPQLVVGTYSTDMNPLQPGTIFNLEMEIRNLGNGDARSATMVIGGGASGSSGGDGTPQPGGVTGGSGDLSTFAPLGSSNLVFLGDIKTGEVVKNKTQLIVNVSANPGAYTLKLSFLYTDAKGNRLVDDQIITLLVYQLPQVEVNYYRDPGPIFAGQMNVLPLQVVNLGRKLAVLGNMTASAEGADVSNNTSLVGSLDVGAFYSLDVNYMPYAAGEQQVLVTINYTDDFNQPRQIQQPVKVTVLEGAPPMPDITPTLDPNGGVPQPAGPTSFWDQVLRFFKGLLGLGSGQPTPAAPGVDLPSGPVDGGSSGPIVVPGGGGKAP